MKHLKIFETEGNFENFKNSSGYVTPNISFMRSSGRITNKPHTPPPAPAMAGDVAYWDGFKVKTTPLSKWKTSLGIPVGVVVVPEGFAPDGKARIMGLKPIDKDGNQSNSHVSIIWGGYGTDTSLTNYTKVPTTDNAGSTSSGSASSGYLPSDSFTDATSFVDPKAKYFRTSNMIPSPYLGDTPNPGYYKNRIFGFDNALSDFNGLSNTQILVGLGTRYTAANAAYKYNDGISNLQWYLPAMGELGYLMPRFNEINNTITTLGGVAVDGANYFWSSSEYSSSNAYGLYTHHGVVKYLDKDTNIYVRPFAILDDGEDSVNLITFTIDGTEQQAEEGMTWREWCNSEYNIDSFRIMPQMGYVTNDTYDYIVYLGNTIVGLDETILQNANYALKK